jgi:hypothetical protein
MQRAGMQVAAPNDIKEDKAQKNDMSRQYQGLNNKQMISTLKDRDNRIQDLVDALEILELKTRKLEQLIQIKDSELRVWQNK